MNRRNFTLWALILCAIFSGERVLADDGRPSRSIATSVQNGWVTVTPSEFQGAINNPLKGFRDYKENGYGLLMRTYIKWSDIEVDADDTARARLSNSTMPRAAISSSGKAFSI